MMISEHNVELKKVMRMAQAAKRVRIWVRHTGQFYLSIAIIVNDNEYSFFSKDTNIEESKKMEDYFSRNSVNYSVNNVEKWS